MQQVNSAVSTASISPSWLPGRGGLMWLALALVGGVAFFWEGITSLVSAWSRPEYSHGYFIPFVALVLFLIKANPLDDAPRPAPTRQSVSFAILLTGVVLGLAGNLTGIPDLIAYGLILSIAGLALIASRGRQRAAILVAVIYLCFMLPLPNFVYWPLSIKLQLLSSEIGVAIISWFGIPVHLDGNIIDLGVYQLQVAEACSGLRYLFPLMSFGFLIAVLYGRRFWQSVVLFLSTVPITIFMNALRIAIIGVVYDRYGANLADGFLHLFEGWVIFMACLAILGLEIVVMRRLTPSRSQIPQRPIIDHRVLARRLARLRSVRASRLLITSAVVLLAVGLVWQLTPPVSAAPQQRDSFSQFPLAFGAWVGETTPLDPDVDAILGADDYLFADFSQPVEPSVNLLIAYYQSQTAGSGIHSPEACIPAGGWEVSGWARLETGLQTAGGDPLIVNRAIIQKGLNRQLVYYWFDQRGRTLTSDYAAKSFTVLDSLVRGRTDGALVRVVTPIGDDETATDADRRIRKFLTPVLATLPAYVPT